MALLFTAERFVKSEHLSKKRIFASSGIREITESRGERSDSALFRW